MNDLHRSLAPLTDETWSAIDDQARATLGTYLSARKLVDFQGPLGWRHSAEPLGRVDALADAPAEGIRASLRRVQPLLELRVDFELRRDELDAVARGADDPDLTPLDEAARRIAYGEDHFVFYGLESVGVRGLCDGAAHEPRGGASVEDYPRLVSEAANVLRQAGVGGPYALALGPAAFTRLSETVGSGGYPVIKHVRRIIDGPIVWAPALEGGLVLSLRGGDFRLTIGRDAAIGYAGHGNDAVSLYFQESLAFRMLGPEAAVLLGPME